MTKVSAIVAIGKNNVIGRDNHLIWRISDDLKRFKDLTMDHPIIMGRKTFESIGKPLPGRTNIVVTRDEKYPDEGIVVVHSVEDALNKAKELDDEEIFIIGGGEIYKQTLPYADKLYLTLINDTADGNVFFPDYTEFTKETFREEREYEGLKYAWVDLEKD